MVLIGVSNDDTKEVADKMVKKMLGPVSYTHLDVYKRQYFR